MTESRINEVLFCDDCGNELQREACSHVRECGICIPPMRLRNRELEAEIAQLRAALARYESEPVKQPIEWSNPETLRCGCKGICSGHNSQQTSPTESVCEDCGKMESSHREVNGERVCYPDTFPDQPMIFRGPDVVMPESVEAELPPLDDDIQQQIERHRKGLLDKIEQANLAEEVLDNRERQLREKIAALKVKTEELEQARDQGWNEAIEAADRKSLFYDTVIEYASAIRALKRER